LPSSFWAAVFLGHQASCLSAVVEDESPAVVERNLFGLPGGALVEALGFCVGGVPFLVEPVEIRIVVGDPFLDGLPDNKERTVCWPFGGRWSRAAAMKSGAVKISKLRLVVWWCGVVVAFGAVDDGLGGGVSSDRVKRLRLTRFSLSR